MINIYFFKAVSHILEKRTDYYNKCEYYTMFNRRIKLKPSAYNNTATNNAIIILFKFRLKDKSKFESKFRMDPMATPGFKLGIFDFFKKITRVLYSFYSFLNLVFTQESSDTFLLLFKFFFLIWFCIFVYSYLNMIFFIVLNSKNKDLFFKYIRHFYRIYSFYRIRDIFNSYFYTYRFDKRKRKGFELIRIFKFIFRIK